MVKALSCQRAGAGEKSREAYVPGTREMARYALFIDSISRPMMTLLDITRSEETHQLEIQIWQCPMETLLIYKRDLREEQQLCLCNS
jgi:hypothetical protein